MSLHVEAYGSGPPLVLIHGWGLHGGVFAPLIAPLAQRFRVLVPDLPGFGYSRAEAVVPSLRELAQRIADVADGPATWLGWSLGGLVALEAARQGKVSRLVLVNATPKFAQAPDWEPGLAPEVLAELARELVTEYRATLTRFLSLQVAPGERATLRTLREAMLARGEPALAALQAGLGFLAHGDLRSMLAGLHVPALVVHGGRDKLVPVAAGRHLAAHLPDARLAVIEGAAHAPFISHPDACLDAIAGFLHA